MSSNILGSLVSTFCYHCYFKKKVSQGDIPFTFMVFVIFVGMHISPSLVIIYIYKKLKITNQILFVAVPFVFFVHMLHFFNQITNHIFSTSAHYWRHRRISCGRYHFYLPFLLRVYNTLVTYCIDEGHIRNVELKIYHQACIVLLKLHLCSSNECVDCLDIHH